MIDERTVGTGAYPYNQTRDACENNHIVGATPLWLPGEQVKRSR
jgi:hypothetical protein